MSEIKITKNSIENSIISSGQVTVGSIDNTDYGNSKIVSNSSGSMAIGYIDSTTVSNTGASISATGLGSFASGYAFIDSTYSEEEREHLILGYHNVIANGIGAHAQGCGTYAGHLYAHAEGYDTTANGNGAHTEGSKTYAGNELTRLNIKATGRYDDEPNQIIIDESDALHSGDILLINNHIFTVQSNDDDIVVFNENISNNDIEWARGSSILKIEQTGGDYAHAEGYNTQATGGYSHASGHGTIANQEAMTAIGKFNVSTNTENTLFVVGDGEYGLHRSDAFRVNSLGSSTTSPSSVQAKVNGISDVYLGCPIGTVVMWPFNTAPEGWLICEERNIKLTATSSATNNTLFQKYCQIYSQTSSGLLNMCTTGPVYFEVTQPEHKEYNKLLKIFTNDDNRDIYGDFKYKYSTTTDNIKINFLDEKRPGSGNLDVSTFCDHFNGEDAPWCGIRMPDLQQKFPLGAKTNGTIGKNGHSASSSGWDTSLGKYGGEPTTTLSANESGLPEHRHKLCDDNRQLGVNTGSDESTTHSVNDTTGSGSHLTYTSYEGGQTASEAHNNIPPYLAINFIIKYK